MWSTGRVPELSEPDERAIRQYVDSQSPPDDKATLVQQVGTRRILGRSHELYDVHCEQSRWWVITNPTNLYQQSDFPQVEQAFIFHLGLGVFMAERSRVELEDPDTEEHIPSAWRRFQQAVNLMNTAEESEDFQAVGIKCRDALISLAKDHAGADWVGVVDQPPKAADFKGWGNIFAERLTDSGRLRSYLRSLVDKTWDLTVWLQHESGATPLDADLVTDATGLLISTIGKLIMRKERGAPQRCPRCDSYRVRNDVEHVEADSGFWEATICASCGWSDEPVFTSWQDHFEDVDVEGYLSRPSTGISDRLHPPEETC